MHKEPIFYYVLIPVAAALWPLLVWGVYLPKAQKAWGQEKTNYEKGQAIIEEILKMDPERLAGGEAEDGGQFDYANAIEKTASNFGIRPENYKLSSGMMVTSGGEKSQSARVSLKDVGIEQFAGFVSAIELRWANLHCSGLKLNKKKEAPDRWDVDIDFKYYY
jgi:hypothetical protein